MRDTFESYGTRHSAGRIGDPEDRMEEFRRELEPFLATEVNVEVDRIPLAGIEQVAMTAGEIGSIEVFLLVGDAAG